MKKVKNFKQFLNEMVDEVQNVEDIEINDEFVQDEIVQNQDEIETSVDEIENPIETDHEPEEIEDLMELVYNKSIGEWQVQGEMDLPSDFDVFYEWFIDEVSEENTTASMKEEGDEVVFHIPEDLYVEYLEEIEKGISEVPSEIQNELPDDIQEDDDIDFE